MRRRCAATWRCESRPANGLTVLSIGPSLPWIGALPPCPPAMMQVGSLHSSASNGASFGGRQQAAEGAVGK